MFKISSDPSRAGLALSWLLTIVHRSLDTGGAVEQKLQEEAGA